MSKQISRKEFIFKTLTGVAALGFIPKQIRDVNNEGDSYRKLGNTGILVSPLCFGAPRTNDESLIKYSVEKGINFIDTGHSYGNGNNEKLVGRAVSGIRKKMVIQTKIRLEMQEMPAKGKGVIAMKTCSGGPYTPSAGIKPDFVEAVKWVLQHKFISAAAVAMASFEQVNEHLSLLKV